MEQFTQQLLEEKLQKADALLARAKEKLPEPEERDELLLRFLFRFIRNSAAFEGFQANEVQLERLLRGYDVPMLRLEEKVQLTGYRDAFYYMRGCVHRGEDLSQDLIRKLHFISTPMGDPCRGVYRDRQIHVAIRTQVPPEPEDVTAWMDRLMEDYHRCTLHPIALAAWFHLQHESIHPLYLANGRTERLLVSHILMSRGYFPLCVRIEDRKDYLHAFDIYYETGDILPMACYLADLECMELEHFLAAN